MSGASAAPIVGAGSVPRASMWHTYPLNGACLSMRRWLRKTRIASIRVMRMTEGVEWSLHCCTLLAVVPEGVALPAARLAEFHGVPAAYLAKHLQALAAAGIVESVPGRRGGYRLARRPADIALIAVVDAVEGADS